MSLSEILTFAFVASLLVMSPGPNGVLIAKTVPTSGRSAGFANVVGFVTAFYIHGALSILGISIILVQSATAFTIVKYLGALYLCWIGMKALLAAVKGGENLPTVAPSGSRTTLRNAYFEGLLTNTLNPKVSMFYLAAFPQFISIGDNAAQSAFMLVSLHALMNALWFSSMVVLFSRLARMTNGDRFQRWVKGTTGLVFLGFGAKLAAYRPNL
ncbi:MAG: LysE family translocator [Halioglobus sp.]